MRAAPGDTTPPDAESARALSRARLAVILAALLLGTLMTAMSHLIITTAMPVVVASLGGLDLYSWAFASMLLSTVVVGPIAGKLSDLYGRKIVYLTGMSVFLAGSALCGTARSMEELILFRGIQGLGAGGVSPIASALMADLLPPEKRGRWQGANGAIWGLASALGPLAGGYLAEHVSWQWVFYINLPPGILAAAVMAYALPGAVRRSGRPSVDYAGMGLFAGALVALMLTTVLGGKAFLWASLQTFGLLALSGALMVAFVRRERVASEPVVPLELFRNSTYQTVVAGLFLSGIGMYTASTFAPLYLQGVLGISPTATGLLFLPTVVVSAVASILGGVYLTRVGYRNMATITMSSAAVGYALLAAAGEEAGVFPIVVGLSVVGSGIGMSFPVFIIVAQNVVERRVMGVATSLVQLTRTLGGALGVAALGAYLASRLFDLLGSGGGAREIAALLRPEALAAMSPVDVAFLRAQLADALRGLFVVGAVAMAVATAVVRRLDEAAIRGAQREQQ